MNCWMCKFLAVKMVTDLKLLFVGWLKLSKSCKDFFRSCWKPFFLLSLVPRFPPFRNLDKWGEPVNEVTFNLSHHYVWKGRFSHASLKSEAFFDVSTESFSHHQGESEDVWIKLVSIGYRLFKVKGRWAMILPPCLLIAVVQQPGTSSCLCWLKHSSEGITWMCRASFTSHYMLLVLILNQ